MIIKTNTSLIRANATDGKLMNKNHTYFLYGNDARRIVEKEYAKNEGDMIHFYKTLKPLNLLDMSNPKSIELLLGKGSNAVNVSIKKAFRVEGNQVRRKSKLKHDVVVSRLLCALGYDGYYAPRMRKHIGDGTFHPEIMLCNPITKVKLIKSDIPQVPLRPPAKKRPRNFNNDIQPVRFFNFGNL